MREWKIVVDLPDAYAAAIGKVVTHWAYLERLLNTIAYQLLNVSPKHGRVAVRSPRADDMVTMIGQLMTLEKVTTTVDLPVVINAVRALKNGRDLIAHNVWVIDPETGSLLVQNLSGNWKPDPAGPKISRRITPEAVELGPEELAELKGAIEAACQAAIKLSLDIAAQLEASRKKPPE